VSRLLAGLLSRIAPSVPDLLLNQAMNLRLGTSGLNFPEIFQQADQLRIDPWTIPTMVEQDSYMYQTTRYNQTVVGRSMVCSVFVCAMWKAGGLFDAVEGGASNVNCGEFTPYDTQLMTFLLANPNRPPACVAADPSNELCQLEGQFTLELANLSSKKPFAHMAEACPGTPPSYDRPADC